jgi:hypothetical protein
MGATKIACRNPTIRTATVAASQNQAKLRRVEERATMRLFYRDFFALMGICDEVMEIQGFAFAALRSGMMGVEVLAKVVEKQILHCAAARLRSG